MTDNDNNIQGIYSSLNTKELIDLLIQKDHEINKYQKLVSEYEDNQHGLEEQIKDLSQRYSTLQYSFDEQAVSLLNILWQNGSEIHVDLINIPSIQATKTNTNTNTNTSPNTNTNTLLIDDKEVNAIVETNDIISKYIIGETLGEGSYAKVKACRLLNSKTSLEMNENIPNATSSLDDHQLIKSTLEYFHSFTLALKMIDKKKVKSIVTMKRISNEIGILKALQHEHITDFYDVIHTNQYIYLIMERGGRDLFEYMHLHQEPLDESFSKLIMKHILEAVGYMHHKGYCHRGLLIS